MIDLASVAKRRDLWSMALQMNSLSLGKRIWSLGVKTWQCKGIHLKSHTFSKIMESNPLRIHSLSRTRSPFIFSPSRSFTRHSLSYSSSSENLFKREQKQNYLPFVFSSSPQTREMHSFSHSHSQPQTQSESQASSMKEILSSSSLTNESEVKCKQITTLGLVVNVFLSIFKVSVVCLLCVCCVFVVCLLCVCCVFVVCCCVFVVCCCVFVVCLLCVVLLYIVVCCCVVVVLCCCVLLCIIVYYCVLLCIIVYYCVLLCIVYYV
jgi:hypothetical protein